MVWGTTWLCSPPEEFAIQRDARSSKSIDELARDHPSVAVLRDEAVAKAKKSPTLRKANLPSGQAYGEPEAKVSVDSRLLLCTVTHVGTDYLLVSYASDNERRKAISTRHIAGIRWGDPLRISTRTPRVNLPQR